MQPVSISAAEIALSDNLHLEEPKPMLCCAGLVSVCGIVWGGYHQRTLHPPVNSLSFCSWGVVAVCCLCQVHLPEWALWLRPGINGDYSSASFRLYASSPAHPEVPLQVDLASGALSTWQDSTQTLHQHSSVQQQDQQQPQQQHAGKPSSVQPVDCGLVSQRLWATAADGTAVPFTLLRKAGQVPQTPQPLLVEVYGAYGHVLESEFKPHRLTLLNRGWSVVLAHVRGGGELGRR